MPLQLQTYTAERRSHHQPRPLSHTAAEFATHSQLRGRFRDSAGGLRWAAMKAPDCRLYLITPPSLPNVDAFAERLEAALDAGDVAALQIRLKEVTMPRSGGPSRRWRPWRSTGAWR
jgi:hypothetical protein